MLMGHKVAHLTGADQSCLRLPRSALRLKALSENSYRALINVAVAYHEMAIRAGKTRERQHGQGTG